MATSINTDGENIGWLPTSIQRKLRQRLPSAAVKDNLESGLSSFRQGYIIERLNQTFGENGWFAHYEIIEQEAHVVVKCKLQAPGYDLYRECFGGHESADRGDAYKGACTDALVKCAVQLGIGLEVYKARPGDLFDKPTPAATRRAKPDGRIINDTQRQVLWADANRFGKTIAVVTAWCHVQFGCTVEELKKTDYQPMMRWIRGEQ